MKLYSGTSETGNISEALSKAITSAKDGLKTDYVEWKLNGMTGKDGGFLHARELTVSIDITKTKP